MKYTKKLFTPLKELENLSKDFIKCYLSIKDFKSESFAIIELPEENKLGYKFNEDSLGYLDNNAFYVSTDRLSSLTIIK